MQSWLRLLDVGKLAPEVSPTVTQGQRVPLVARGPVMSKLASGQ